ncbi:site-specific integrase [Terasakiella sp. SH-1]|uniref:tyrosine-type recombinase/integrase n=1 Tax=Terasakiella sp. SH-1 TaxID=2560057 RepID=UPI00107419A4|nr:site-specific integrase [Terasakiella sp. SH-1]
MPKVKLTALAVEKIQVPEKGQVDYFDASMPAFGVRVSYAGSRTFFVMTRLLGKQIRLSLGKAQCGRIENGLSLKDARAKAGEWVELAQQGIDPRKLRNDEKKRNETTFQNTFSVVADRFMRQYVKPRLAVKTQKGYDGVLFGQDLDGWKNIPVATISRADVRERLEYIVERGCPTLANNTLAYLRKFFNWCVDQELIEHSPVDRLKAPAPKVVGDRVLSEDEIKVVWQAFENEGLVFGDLFKLLLLTGQRRSEVIEMTIDECRGLNTLEPIWEIPAHRTKNKRPQIVYLSHMAAEIVRNRPIFGEKGFLFTTNGATPVSGISKAKKRIDEDIESICKKKEIPVIPHWRIHDLRRSMVTIMNEQLSIPPHVVEACVNHISSGAKTGVAGVYNKALYLKERRKAFDAWGTFVQELLNEKQSVLV